MCKKILFVSLLFITILQSCGLSNREIEDHYWKLSEMRRGNPEKPLLHRVDHIAFNESKYYILVKDTIYRNDKPYAVITDRQKGTSTSIEIVIIGSLDTLRYVAK